jgi:uncharacterized protein YgiM (DUF1202 family)
MAVGGVTAAMLLVLLAACGGAEASPSASADAATEAPIESMAPEVEEPSAEVEEPAVPETVSLVAQCAGVGVRKGPTKSDDVLVRVNKGTKVRVVETVTGDPYEAGSCGTSGDEWLKIDRIGGKSVQALYGVPFGYTAGGFFE